MSVEEALREAIESRSPVSLCYETTGSATRIVHPHVLFRTTTGKICIDAYQVEGATSSGERVPDWRQMNVAKITRIELLEGTFQTAPGLNLAADKYAPGLIAHV
ncbi:MAG TPA: hypothetical protein VFY75_10360 [Solirubrobacterales bacterium]|nr:hypothetical protein [Solirubrobacterales bacterium]